MQKKVVIGTRSSKLALWQAQFVAECIHRNFPAVEVVLRHIVTRGDRQPDLPFAKIGGKGLFTYELEKEMLAGGIDLAVHSLKDLPTEFTAGLTLGAVGKRIHPGDVLISPQYRTLDALPQGARVGTSSLRRQAQLLYSRPDLEIVPLRGNVDTRLEKLAGEQLDAIVLAAAGLERLGRSDVITQVLPFAVCLPAAGQGALAVESREDDRCLADILACLNDGPTRAAVTAERSFLKRIGGGCQVPVGVYGETNGAGISLQAAILSPDGRQRVHDRMPGHSLDAEKLGSDLAERLLAAGGRNLLAAGGTAAGRD